MIIMCDDCDKDEMEFDDDTCQECRQAIISNCKAKDERWQIAMRKVWHWYETHMGLLDEGDKGAWVTWGKTLEAMSHGKLEGIEAAMGIRVTP